MVLLASKMHLCTVWKSTKTNWSCTHAYLILTIIALLLVIAMKPIFQPQSALADGNLAGIQVARGGVTKYSSTPAAGEI